MNVEESTLHSTVAEPTTAEVQTETHVEEHAEGGLSVDPWVIGFQALNFIVLLIVLQKILYKPLMGLLKEREERIQKGIENAEQADLLLQESNATREKMLKDTRAESQQMAEASRQSAEHLRAELLAKAQDEAARFVAAGKNALESEKERAMHELRAHAVDMVVKTTEKLLREKVDSKKDSDLIEASLKTFATQSK